MEFLDKIRIKRWLSTKKELAQLLEKTVQAYYSLERATDRITLKGIVTLRNKAGLSDTELLDLLEEESNLAEELKKRRPSKAEDS